MTVTPRLALAAIATLAVISGIGAGMIMAPHAWALDIDRYLRAARDLQAGQFGIDRGYLYSPMAALLTLPLLAVPAIVATWGWLVAKVVVLMWMVRSQTRGLGRVEVALAAVAALAFVPTVYDLLLGNVTVFVVLAVGLVAWRRDDWGAGIALGLVLATAPKPQLIPVLIWMLAYRRRALVGASVTAAVATVVTAVLVGSASYAAWIDVLMAPDYLTSPMAGNQTVDALLPAIALPIKVATVALFAVALWRGASSGLIAALCTGSAHRAVHARLLGDGAAALHPADGRRGPASGTGPCPGRAVRGDPVAAAVRVRLARRRRRDPCAVTRGGFDDAAQARAIAGLTQA